MFREDERMDEHHAVADDQSHYEISLTAGQAFVAFVLLLLSLAASFAFGLMIGKGQSDDRLVVQKATPVVTEASMAPTGAKKSAGEIVELGVPDDDFEESTPVTDSAAPAATETTATTAILEEGAAPVTEPTEPAATPTPATTTVATPAPATPAPAREVVPATRVTTYAQLLSTGDQKTAEKLAVRLINRGYTSAYVERGTTDKGPIYRVRVRFNSDAEAQAAKPKLQEFSPEVWITSK
jgi:cell division septation protein DedD